MTLAIHSSHILDAYMDNSCLVLDWIGLSLKGCVWPVPHIPVYYSQGESSEAGKATTASHEEISFPKMQVIALSSEANISS